MREGGREEEKGESEREGGRGGRKREGKRQEECVQWNLSRELNTHLYYTGHLYLPHFCTPEMRTPHYSS